MRFTALVFAAGLVASVAASPQASGTSTRAASQSQTSVSVPTPTQTSSYPPEVTECLKLCPESDPSCRAVCLGAPAPNEDDMNQTVTCAGKCDKGDGSPGATQKYSDCVQSCIKEHYLPNDSDKPTQSQGSGGSTASGSAAPSASGTGRPTGTGSSNANGTDGSQETAPGAASGLTISASSVAIIAAIAAAIAL